MTQQCLSVVQPLRILLQSTREDTPLWCRMREIAITLLRQGILADLYFACREDQAVNHQRVYRIYREDGLKLRSKRPRRYKSITHRLEMPSYVGLNQVWSLGFVSAALFDDSWFRYLTIVDNCSRECLAIMVGKCLRGSNVVEALEALCCTSGLTLMRIHTDNVSEFISKEMDRWAYENKVIRITPDPESRQTILSQNLSTDLFGINARMHIDSYL